MVLILGLMFIGCDDSAHSGLPYLGPFEVDYDGSKTGTAGDTIFHAIPDFTFINQDSLEITEEDYFGHVYVADFFFTHCPSICPVMTSQMGRLEAKLKEEGILGEVKLLSHTVDPKRDFPSRLKEYREMNGIDGEHWNMVTGKPAQLDEQTRYGYMVTAFESDSAAGGFFHTDQFVLVDRNRHIRGYYDGTSTASVDELFEDIVKLNQERNDK